jgi:putative ABC transport system permease protein
MGILNKLTIKNLKLNRKRTIVTIIGIMLSVALIDSVATMYSSAIKSLIEYETYEKGNFHVAYYDVSKDDVLTIKNNLGVGDVYLTKDIGYAYLSASKNEYKPYIFVKGFTKESLDNLSVKLVEGRLPENEDEIIIPTHLKTNGRVNYNVGDEITLDIGTRVSFGEVLSQNDSYYEENEEEIVNTTTKTYKVVGIIERPATNIESYDAPGFTFITYMDEDSMSGNVSVYAKYNQNGVNNYLQVTSNILGVDEKTFTIYMNGEYESEEEYEKIAIELNKAKYTYNVNSYLITLEKSPFSNSSLSALGMVVLVVCLIIVGTSIFCIKNSFDISITEKIRSYGMLRSVGATKKQIKNNVFYEATILGLIGIPLGLLLGFLASYVLIIISNIYLKDMYNAGFKLVLSSAWYAVIFSIILGIITIYASALKSARRASKLSIIDSVRNSANIKIKSKKIRCPKIIQKVFGIGGEISYKNLKRNKKKYRTTIISIIVSVATFISLFSFMKIVFSEVDSVIDFFYYNISLTAYNYNDDTYRKILETTTLDNIENYSVIRRATISLKHSDSNYNQEYIDFLNLKFDSEIDDDISIIAVGSEQYNKYIESLGLNYDEVKDKAILVDYSSVEKYDDNNKSTSKYMRTFNFKSGDKLEGIIPETGKSCNIEIVNVTEKKPFSLENNNALLIVSDELYDILYPENNFVEIYYLSNDPNKLQDDIDEFLTDEEYDLINLEETKKMLENFYTLIAIFLYGFIIVISLIGITNIFNTITTNMELRRQEFAMIKSVGMTKREFRRMIRLESIFMGLKSLLFGIPIGIALSYLMYYLLKAGLGDTYHLPILAIVISILAVFILIFVIMKYSMNKINKQNIIETIRNDNI